MLCDKLSWNLTKILQILHFLNIIEIPIDLIKKYRYNVKVKWKGEENARVLRNKYFK